MNLQQWGALLFLALLWGGSFFFIGVAVTELPTFTISAARCVIAVALLAVVVHFTATGMGPLRSHWRVFAGMALFNNVVPYLLLIWAQHHVSSALASILIATTPVFTVVVAHLATAERPSLARLAGVLLGFAGVAVLVGADALAGLGQGLLPQLALLGAALCYALAAVLGRPHLRGVPVLVTSAGQLGISSLILLPLALLFDAPWALATPGWGTWASVLALGALCTGLAYLVYFWLLEHAGATNLLLVTLLVPVTAVTLGVLFLGERLAVSQLAGMALIALALVCIDARVFRLFQRSSHSSNR